MPNVSPIDWFRGREPVKNGFLSRATMITLTQKTAIADYLKTHSFEGCLKIYQAENTQLSYWRVYESWSDTPDDQIKKTNRADLVEDIIHYLRANELMLRQMQIANIQLTKFKK
jgi:hypothetical protein